MVIRNLQGCFSCCRPAIKAVPQASFPIPSRDEPMRLSCAAFQLEQTSEELCSCSNLMPITSWVSLRRQDSGSAKLPCLPCLFLDQLLQRLPEKREIVALKPEGTVLVLQSDPRHSAAHGIPESRLPRLHVRPRLELCRGFILGSSFLHGCC